MQMTDKRWLKVTLLVTFCVSGAIAQRGFVGERVQVERPAMTATGSPLDGAERSSGLTGPSLGYIWDASTRNLHVVTGIAGSSLTGPPLHRGAELRLAAISPEGGYAVVADADDAVLFYSEQRVRSQEGIALWQDAGRVTHAAVSPSGKRFALLAADAGRVAVYTVSEGAPGTPAAFNASLPSGDLVRLAVADDQDAVFVVTRSAAGTAVSRIAADGTVRSLASLPGVVDLALFAGSERALLLDSVQNALYVSDFGAATPNVELVASQAEGIDQPLAMAISGDGRSVAIASAASRRATVIDLTSRATRQLELAETPTGMRRLNARGVYQLTDASSGPMLLLEVQAEGARTVYVPRAENDRSPSAGRAGLRE